MESSRVSIDEGVPIADIVEAVNVKDKGACKAFNGEDRDRLGFMISGFAFNSRQPKLLRRSVQGVKVL